MTIERVTLVRREMAVSRIIADEVVERMERPELFIERDIMMRAWQAQARTWLATWQPEEIRVSYPLTWWQAFKERWFPMWLRRRFPVRYEHVKMERYVAYPEIPLRAEMRAARGFPRLEVMKWSALEEVSEDSE